MSRADDTLEGFERTFQVAQADPAAMRELLKQAIPKEVQDSPSHFSRWCSTLGKGWLLFPDIERSTAEYARGIEGCPADLQWDYYTNWAMAHFTAVRGDKGFEEKLDDINRSIELLRKAERAAADQQGLSEQSKIGIASLLSFLYLFLHRDEQARQVLSTLDYSPCDDATMKDAARRSWVAHIPKGMFSAIELGDEKLLDSLCRSWAPAEVLEGQTAKGLDMFLLLADGNSVLDGELQALLEYHPNLAPGFQYLRRFIVALASRNKAAVRRVFTRFENN